MTGGAAVPLSVAYERANARARHTEYLARAYACRDGAARARNTHDAQLLHAMTIVWELLAQKWTDAHHATAEPSR